LFNSLGTYYVTAYNNCGLRNDTFTIYKCLTDSLFKCKISVPNAFTPNNDGKNDGFRAYTNCESLKSYNLRIYNRFGEVIFNSTDIYEEWDGRYKNILQDIGVFAFLIEYESEYTNGIEIVKGNVTLVK
jgi:gliding motility-associated-like protein